MELVDAASLLWRLQVSGHDVGGRWNDVVSVYENMTDDGYYTFNDMHAMMAFVSTGRRDAVDRLLATLVRRAGDDDSNGRMTREVGLPTCQAIDAFGRGHYERAVELLRPVRLVANRFGGSHAQRDVLDWTMIEAALRGEQYDFAEAIANERTARKPESPMARWFHNRAVGQTSKIETAA